MSLLPGSAVLIDKVPELASPRGFLRLLVTCLGLLVLVVVVLQLVEGVSPFLAIFAQLLLYAANRWLLYGFYNGPRDRLPYSDAFFNRLLPAIGLNLGSLLYIVLNRGGLVVGATDMRIVPAWLGWLLALYLLVTALLLAWRSLQAAGVDTLSGVFVYFPDEGRRVTSSVYELLRHPMYSGLDRTALAFGLINGSSFALLLALLFVLAWHPVWYGMEERDLVSRFGDEYRDYRERVPGTIPRSPAGELTLLEALVKRSGPTPPPPG